MTLSLSLSHTCIYIYIYVYIYIYIQKEKSVAISSLYIRGSPSTFEREEIGPRLSNDKRVALSSLRRRRWPYSEEKTVGLHSLYITNQQLCERRSVSSRRCGLNRPTLDSDIPGGIEGMWDQCWESKLNRASKHTSPPLLSSPLQTGAGPENKKTRKR